MKSIKQHIDTLVILGGIFTSFLCMNAQFNNIEKDISTIKTVLIMKNIMPVELAKSKNSEKIK